MNFPVFDPTDDPGPSFGRLLQRTGAVDLELAASAKHGESALAEISHGTTVVSAKYDGGVIIAGDRRATSGNLISHRNMKKVFPADRWSGVAIAGAAGPALEMVKIFQLQLEHYEKVEGHPLSLEGKANQLSQMLRSNLPAAMQGLVVVPIFAGYDRRRNYGRLFAYDVTGGRYEEEDYVASGSGSLFARTVIKMGHRADLSQSDAIDLMIRSLFAAADDDSATGGPDSMRGIYPIVATISADGYQEVDEADVAGRFEQVLADFAEQRTASNSGGEA